MEHWPYIDDDEWRALSGAVLADYETDGTLHTEPVEPFAARLKALVDAGKPEKGTQPTHGAVGLTLQRGGAAVMPGEHFAVKSSALATLVSTFLPPMPTAAESAAPAPQAVVAAAAPARPPTSDPTAKAGAGARTGGSAPMFIKNHRPMATGAGARPRLGGGAAAAAAAAKRSRMKMMDGDEATTMLVASNKPPEKKRAKPSAGAGASGDKKARPEPFGGALVDAPTGLVHYFQDRLKKWTYAPCLLLTYALRPQLRARPVVDLAICPAVASPSPAPINNCRPHPHTGVIV